MHSRQPRKNRCVFSCKTRLAFILTVDLFAAPANPGESVVFSHVKCVSRQPRRNRCVFPCKMRLVFILTVNLFASPANPGIVVFSHVDLYATPANPGGVFSCRMCGATRVHSLVDFSAFQWSFCSHESRDITK